MAKLSMSRRRFLQSSGAAALWLPTTVKGYTASEIQALYVDGEMQEDVSKWELDTPCLCVDLDLLEANIATMKAQMRRLGLGHDPRRSVATTDVSFYRWTQWIFLQIFNSWYDEELDRARPISAVSYTHLRAHETRDDVGWRG